MNYSEEVNKAMRTTSNVSIHWSRYQNDLLCTKVHIQECFTYKWH